MTQFSDSPPPRPTHLPSYRQRLARAVLHQADASWDAITDAVESRSDQPQPAGDREEEIFRLGYFLSAQDGNWTQEGEDAAWQRAQLFKKVRGQK